MFLYVLCCSHWTMKGSGMHFSQFQLFKTPRPFVSCIEFSMRKVARMFLQKDFPRDPFYIMKTSGTALSPLPVLKQNFIQIINQHSSLSLEFKPTEQQSSFSYSEQQGLVKQKHIHMKGPGRLKCLGKVKVVMRTLSLRLSSGQQSNRLFPQV